MGRVEQARLLRARIDSAPTRDDLIAQADELRDALAAVEAQIVPAWEAPVGAHDSYGIGDRVFHNGRAWTSLVDGNVWEPGAPGTHGTWQ